MRNFRNIAKEIRLLKLLNEPSIKKMPVLHFLPEYDEEHSNKDREESLKILKIKTETKIKAETKIKTEKILNQEKQDQSLSFYNCTNKQNYQNLLLKESNYFLKQTNRIPSLIELRIPP